MKFILFFLSFLSTIIAIDLTTILNFNYDNNNNIFVTNNINGYDPKYYQQGDYIYSIVENDDSCLNSCLSWINTSSPKNTIAITGFDVRYISDSKCECKGQILNLKKIPYHSYIFKIDKYNKNYYYESDLVLLVTEKSYFTSDENLCFELLSKHARTKLGLAITNFNTKCYNVNCECSGNILYII
jgi:hypothetical protein